MSRAVPITSEASQRFEVTTDEFKRFLLSFFSTTSLNSLSDLSTSIYEFPLLQKIDIDQIDKMIAEREPLIKCCQFLGKYFNFDPAFVTGCTCKQFTEYDAKLGLVSNSLGFIASQEFYTLDYFEILFKALTEYLKDQEDCQISYMLAIVFRYLKNCPEFELPSTLIITICNFATNYPTLSHEFVEILSDILLISNSQSNLVLESISKVIEKCTIQEQNYVLNAIKPAFDKGEPSALSLLCQIINDNTIGLANDFLLGFASKVIEEIRIRPCRISDQYEKYYFEEINEFPCGISPPSLEEFGIKGQPSSSFTSQSLIAYEALFSMLPSVPASDQLSVFTEVIESSTCEDEIRLPLVSFVSKILKSRKNTPIPSHFVQVIIKSPIFTTKANIFENNYHCMTELSSLRNTAIQGMLQNDPSEFEDVLITLTADPMLFAESVGRAQAVLSFSAIRAFLRKRAVCAVVAVLKELSKQKCMPAYRAWSTLFSFITSALDDNECADALFSLQEFTDFYFSYFSNPSLNSVISVSLRKHLTTHLPSLESLRCLINFTRRMMDSDSPGTATVVETFADGLAHHPTECPTIATLLAPILKSVKRTKDSKVLQAALGLALSASVGVEGFDLSEADIELMGAAIDAAGAVGAIEIQSVLLAIMARSRSANSQAMFLIHVPAMIPLVLHSSADLSQIIGVFDRLVKFSIYNCLQCHVGSLDLLLIEAAIAFPKPFEFRGWKFDQNVSAAALNNELIPLLTYMFLQKTSLQVCESFISLAVPKGGVFPQSAETVISALNHALVAAPRSPKLTIAYSAGSPLFDYSIEGSSLSDGFTFDFQVMFDQALTALAPGQPVLLSLEDSQGGEIIVFANGTTLFCEVHANGQATAATLYGNFEPCQWTIISLAFTMRHGDMMRLTFSIDSEQPALFHMRSPKFQGTVKVRVGGFRDRDVGPQFTYCYLGPYYLINAPVKHSEVVAIVQGERDHSIYNMTPLQEDWTQESYFHSINKIAERYDLFECLVPFFDFALTSPPHFLERLADILSHADPERPFQMFDLIGRGLRNGPSSVLTYQLYQRLAALMQKKPSKQLLTNILFSFDLWMRAPSTQLVRIASHWEQVLEPTFPTLFSECFSIGEIATLMRMYLYYDRIETEIVPGLERDPNLDVSTVRSHLDRLLIRMARKSLSVDDVRTLMSHAFTCKDSRQISSIVDLLKEIGPCLAKPEGVAKELHFLTMKKDPSVFIPVVKAILSIGKSQANVHAELIASHINETHYTMDTLKALLSILYDIPESLCISAVVAANIESVAVQLLISGMNAISEDSEKSKKVLNVRTWYMWPVISAHRFPALAERMAEAIAAIIKNEMHFGLIDAILAFSDFIGDCEFSAFTTYLLHSIADIALEQKSNQICSNTLMRIARHILFRPARNTHSIHLIEAFKESPFHIEEQNIEITGIKTQKDILNILKKNETAPAVLAFGAEISMMNDGNDNLLRKAARIASYVNNENETTGIFVSVFDYFMERLSFQEEDKYKHLCHLSLQIPHFAAVMALSYRDFSVNEARVLGAHISAVIETSSSLLMMISDETVNKASSSIGLETSIIETRAEESEDNHRLFQLTHMHKYSIWGEYSPLLDKTMRQNVVCHYGVLSKMKMRPSIPTEHRRTTALLPHPEFATKAMLLKLKHDSHCVFAIVDGNIVIKSAFKTRIIDSTHIRYILHRSIRNKLTALEFVNRNGKSYLVDFAPKTLATIVPKLSTLNLPLCNFQRAHYSIFMTKLDITAKWVYRRMSNFDYLCAINFMGGRSYRSASLYPIMPNVVYDIMSDLDDSHSYRDLVREKLYIRPQSWLVQMPMSGVTHTETVQAGSFDSSLLKFDGDHVNIDSDKRISFDEDESLSGEPPAIISACSLEFIPEVFSSPMFIEGLSLPKGITADILVERLRYALESEFVSKQLHRWIDRIFGIDQPQFIKVQQIFQTPHPARAPEHPHSTKSIKVSLPEDLVPISAAALEMHSGTIVRGVSKKRGLFEAKLKGKEFIVSIINERTEHTLFAPFVGGCALINNQDAGATIYVGGNSALVSPTLEAHFVDDSTKFAAVAGTGGVAYALDTETKEMLGVCRVSPHVPCCVSASRRFRTLAVGTTDGLVMLYDIYTGHFERCIDIKERPRAILISRERFRIIVRTQSKVLSFTSCGTLLASQNLKLKGLWTCLGRSGIDRLIACDENGTVRAYNSDTLGPICTITEIGSEVPVSIKCNEISYSVGILTNNNSLIITPLLLSK